MKAGKEETTCLLGVAGSVKASVHVLVKGEKVELSAPEPVIKDGKGKRNSLLDGEKRSVHGKARGNSWKMKKSKLKSAMFNMTLTLLSMEGIKSFLVLDSSIHPKLGTNTKYGTLKNCN